MQELDGRKNSKWLREQIREAGNKVDRPNSEGTAVDRQVTRSRDTDGQGMTGRQR